MSRTVAIHGRRLARNSLLNLAAQAAPLVVAVACMPVVVRRLDAPRFGLLTLAWTLLNYFGVFDLGLGRAATKYVAEALGHGERQQLRALVGSAVLLQVLSGLCGAALVAGLAGVLAGRVLHVPAALVPEAQACFLWLALSLPLVLVSGTLFGVLEAAQRFDRTSAIRLPAGSASFLIPLAGVLLHWSLPGIVAWLVATRAATVVALAVACRAEFPELRGRPQSDAATLRMLARFGGWITVSSLVAPLLVSLDRFVVGSVAGLVAVAHYAAPTEMVTRLLVVPASLVGALFPAFSALQGRGETARLPVLAGRASRFLLVLLGPLLAATAALAADLMRLWLGPEYAGDSARALAILCAGVLLNALAQVPFALLQAVGRPDLTARFHLFELPLHALALWWFVHAWGVPGAALAWGLRAGIDALLLFGAAGRCAGLTRRALGAEQVPRTAAFVVLLAIAAFLAATATAGAGRWFAVLGLVIAGAGAGWRFVLHAADRDLVQRALRPGGAA